MNDITTEGRYWHNPVLVQRDHVNNVRYYLWRHHESGNLVLMVSNVMGRTDLPKNWTLV